jgi:hypothetical protein
MIELPGKGIQACEEYCKARKEQRAKSKGLRAKSKEINMPNELFTPPRLCQKLYGYAG